MQSNSFTLFFQTVLKVFIPSFCIHPCKVSVHLPIFAICLYSILTFKLHKEKKKKSPACVKLWCLLFNNYIKLIPKGQKQEKVAAESVNLNMEAFVCFILRLNMAIVNDKTFS